ncbi:MAG TPA: GlsB/YeaQ/YmgE family stress response membrane protein [Propionibacteriaceae bacterium]|nr:GlsB/YeaQ/YmgE family stress response membrane protein [Propionibacteriaceae bacterium]
MEIIGVIIAGIVIGVLGKFVAPGDKDNIPIWLTILCGIGGVILGWFLYTAFGGRETAGIDWIRWLIAIAVAAVLVVIASTLTGRNTSRRAV